jgi:hypothetical protein
VVVLVLGSKPVLNRIEAEASPGDHPGRPSLLISDHVQRKSYKYEFE